MPGRGSCAEGLMVAPALRINREAIHHGAGIALLSDRYASR